MPSNREQSSLDEIRANLRIDPDDMDTMLVQHAEYFDQIGERVVNAADLVATLKVELEKLTAELDRDIRANNARNETKMTETQVANTIKSTPRHEAAARKLADAQRNLSALSSLKESFQQRSYMLRELNQKQIARIYTGTTERGGGGGAARRAAIGDRNRAVLEDRAAERRRNERGQPERYRPARNDDGD
jgi:hypothetical protein